MKPDDMPMPPDVYAEHVRRRGLTPRPDPLQPVPSREPMASTSPLAAELLAEAVERPLESGELLLVSEEAALADLETAAAAFTPADEQPDPDIDDPEVDDPMLAALTAPRLLSPRVWEVMGWQPPLAEHLRLLEGALLAGRSLSQTMLVGHVETFVERIEHVVRLRDMITVAAGAGGGVAMNVRLAVADDLPAATPQLDRILAEARPEIADTDVRHAIAVARLALGSGVVRTPAALSLGLIRRAEDHPGSVDS